MKLTFYNKIKTKVPTENTNNFLKSPEQWFGKLLLWVRH